MLNSEGVRVDVGVYVRSTTGVQMIDGIVITTNNSYDSNTGLITLSSVSGAVTGSTSYKYFWEAYDVTRARNILTPVILTKKFLNGQYVEANAIRYKSWASTNNPSGVFSSFDNYSWKGTGAPDFSVWDVN